MNSNTVNMMRYKRCAVTPTEESTVEKLKVEGPIHPTLQKIISDLGSVNLEMLNQIETMAVGLIRWINKEDGSTEASKVTASERILNCYVAALQGEIGWTATELVLRGLRLKTLPPEIGRLTSLTDLSLSNNELITVPTEIGDLTSLNWLYLNNNQLTILPAEIVELTRLERLFLGGNRLTTLPPEIGGLTSLRMLAIDNNQLTTLPPGIGSLTSLKWLDLNINQFTILPAEIVELTMLKRLCLDSNQLTTLPPEIGGLTSLTKLGLSRNQLASVPASITNVGSNYPGRTVVDLQANPLPDSVLTRLREASNNDIQFQVSIVEQGNSITFSN